MTSKPTRRVTLLFLAVGSLAAPPLALGASLTVREPAFGLPHIYGDTDAQMARESGREVAKDRLAQLILLARVGRGTLYQAFAPLDPTTLDDDIQARRLAYTSSELNNMYAKLPARERALILEYCKGVNDTIDAVYAGSLPEPIEVNILRALGLGEDLFGNATDLSDGVDPHYAPPGGDWPNSGFQFTPEMAMAIGVLEVRNFGLDGFDEASRLAELQALIAKHGTTAGTEIWSDLNFVNDPLAPVTVPDPSTPGYGGPVAAADRATRLATAAGRFPRYDYALAARRLAAAADRRAATAASLGAWPQLGSYAWVIGGARTASGWPWLGGFPQTGIQTPSIMHFAENRSAEGADHRINGIGMEFAGAPLVLIGQTDTVGWTSTTAQLPVLDTFFEEIVNESTDTLRYNDEGTPAPLSQRAEFFQGGLFASTQVRIFWRSHARGGNGGSRAVANFLGDAEGTAESGTATTLVDNQAAFGAGLVGGHVAVVGGTGAGQIRPITAVPNAKTLTVGPGWSDTPDGSSEYVAVAPGNTIIAAAVDSAGWLEESTTVLGFSLMQRAEDIFDVREGARLMPTTHNFPAADNRPFNGVGTAGGAGGNIGYWSSGYSRVRQDGTDPRLPLDGTVPNPLVVVSGTVAAASPTMLSAASGAFSGNDFSPPPLNFRYDNPTLQPTEFIVVITGGTGYRQTRRIAGNDASSLTIETAWGVTPAPGDTFEVMEVVAMPEAINPAEGYMANWNNKAATTDPGNNFGREFRHIYILERLAAENAWDRAKQRQLNEDVAGFDGKGKIGRFLIPRLRQAVDRLGNGFNPDVDTVLAALEAHDGAPEVGRKFIDPVFATTEAGEVSFLNSLVDQLARDIYGDEYAGAVSVPGGSRAMNVAQHAIDSKAGDVSGAYAQAYAGDYFNDEGLLDHFLCYNTKNTGGQPAPADVAGLAFADKFEVTPLSIDKPKRLCNPADADGAGIRDPDTHLRSRRLKAADGTVLFSPAAHTNVRVTNQFGEIFVDLKRRADVLLPAATSVPGGPMPGAPDPTAHDVDHFRCYKASTTPGTPKFPPGVQVTLEDAFTGAPRLFDVKRPRVLCTPAGKDGVGVKDPVGHLMCYRVTPALGEPLHTPRINIGVSHEFGSERVDTKKEDWLCVPSVQDFATALDGWERTVLRSLSALASAGIPVDASRAQSTYRHPLAGLFSELEFEPTPAGNRGTYEQIVEVGPVVNGEFIFPLGQSGLFTGGLGGVDSIDPNADSLHPIWRDWRFVPLLHVAEDLPSVASGDSDGDGVLDGFERWYFGDLTRGAADDGDADGASLLEEFQAGSDPTDADTDDDGAPDGSDGAPQDRLVS